MTEEMDNSVKAAYLEYEKEPMDDYYDSKFAGYFSRKRVSMVLKEIGSRKKVLDVGCEAGYVSLKMADKGHEVVAFDICEPALEKFKEKLKGREDVQVFKAFAQDIPQGDDLFDAIVCTEVIEHMPELDKVFSEFSRVLKKDGVVVITFPNESLRKKIYPIVKLFGIDTDVEKEVTLYSYSFKEIKEKLSDKFSIKKEYSLPVYFPMTRVLVCGKKSL